MKQFNKILAVLVAMFLLLSLIALPVFADEGDDQTTPVETTGENDSSDTETTGESDSSDSETPTETTGESDSSDGESTDESAGSTVQPATDNNSDTSDEKGLTTAQIIWIVVGGVVVVAGAVLGIIFRVKVGKFFRVYKSEIKKVVWLPWNQTCKSTLVVLVILLVCAAAICLVDYGLSQGFLAFLNLFKA